MAVYAASVAETVVAIDAFPADVVSRRAPIVVYDPRYMELPHWSALVSASLLPFGFAPRSAAETNWREWGQRIREIPEIAALQVPDPKHSSNWTEWAYALNGRLWMR